MTMTDPFAQVIERTVLDCGEADGICDLGPLPGEDRPTWLARLRERFRANPPAGRYAAPPSLVHLDEDEWAAVLEQIAREG